MGLAEETPSSVVMMILDMPDVTYIVVAVVVGFDRFVVVILNIAVDSLVEAPGYTAAVVDIQRVEEGLDAALDIEEEGLDTALDIEEEDLGTALETAVDLFYYLPTQLYFRLPSFFYGNNSNNTLHNNRPITQRCRQRCQQEYCQGMKKQRWSRNSLFLIRHSYNQASSYKQ